MANIKKLMTLFFIMRKRKGKIQLLSSNTTLTMPTMNSPSSWTCQRRSSIMGLDYCCIIMCTFINLSIIDTVLNVKLLFIL
jgi:hypothetical protein